MLKLMEPFASAWATKNIFDETDALCTRAEGKDIYRNKEGRITIRFAFNEEFYFLKRHYGVGWGEIIKNLLQLRLPVIGAANELHAANKLNALGVDTLMPVAFASKGLNPAKRQSLIISRALPNCVSLEDYCRNWQKDPPPFVIKHALTVKIAETARQMHEAGMNHRDFYICHFLLEQGSDKKINSGESFRCYLIDLHRCQIRNKVPARWLIKDLGGLLYSTMDLGLSKKDYYRFIKLYTGRNLRVELANPLWKKVLHNAECLYKKDFGKQAPHIF